MQGANVEAVKLLLSLGLDPNARAQTGRTPLHGAGHKGRPDVIQVSVDAGAKLDLRDYGMDGNDAGGRLEEHTWLPVDYADGDLVCLPSTQNQCMRMPPSTIRVAPCTKSAFGEINQDAASAICSAFPTFPTAATT